MPDLIVRDPRGELDCEYFGRYFNPGSLDCKRCIDSDECKDEMEERQERRRQKPGVEPSLPEQKTKSRRRDPPAEDRQPEKGDVAPGDRLFDKFEGNYMQLPYLMAEEFFWYMPAKWRLFFWILRETFGYPQKDKTYRLCRKLPKTAKLASLLKIKPDDRARVVKNELVREKRIVQWKQGKDLWVAPNPAILDGGDRAAIARRLEKVEPGESLRVDRMGKVSGVKQTGNQATVEDLQRQKEITWLRDSLIEVHLRCHRNYELSKKDEKGFSLAAERLYPVYERIGGMQGIRHPNDLAEEYVGWMDNYTKNYKTPPHGGNYCNVDNIKRFEQEWFS